MSNRYSIRIGFVLFLLAYLASDLINCLVIPKFAIARFERNIDSKEVSVFTKVMAMSPSKTSSSTSYKDNKKKGLYSYAEARKIARGHGFSTTQEFIDYDCPGAYQLPKNPQEVWAEEWKGWDDFLGVCLCFEEGRNVARAIKDVNTEEDYLNLFKEKKLSDDDIASRLPYRPDLKYKDKWISWDDFLMG